MGKLQYILERNESKNLVTNIANRIVMTYTFPSLCKAINNSNVEFRKEYSIHGMKV